MATCRRASHSSQLETLFSILEDEDKGRINHSYSHHAPIVPYFAEPGKFRQRAVAQNYFEIYRDGLGPSN